MSSEKYRIMNVVFEITAKTDELPPPPPPKTAIYEYRGISNNVVNFKCPYG